MIVRIKELLKERAGMSLYRFSQVYGIHTSTVWQWAVGKTQPKYEYMELLCRVCKCTLDDMFILERQGED